MTTGYLLDANVFIESHQRQYGMDFCPGFWDWVAARNSVGRVFSIDRVCAELSRLEDKLCDWAKTCPQGFFLEFDLEAADRLEQVAGWASAQTRFRSTAISEFFGSADMYIASFALAHGYTVVTQEVSAPGSTKKVKLPDVCLGLGVRCASLWDLLRAEGAKFVHSP